MTEEGAFAPEDVGALVDRTPFLREGYELLAQARDQVLVLEPRRGNGVGTQLMQAAMNSLGGKLYLCCHEERIPFYERLGFTRLPNGYDDAPESVQAFWREIDDYPTPPDHEHFFLTAR